MDWIPDDNLSSGVTGGIMRKNQTDTNFRIGRILLQNLQVHVEMGRLQLLHLKGAKRMPEGAASNVNRPPADASIVSKADPQN